MVWSSFISSFNETSDNLAINWQYSANFIRINLCLLGILTTVWMLKRIRKYPIMSSRQLEEKLENEQHTKLAEVLGITSDELSQTEYEIDSNESKDGVIHDYFVVFDESSSKEVLNKIKGIDDKRTVSLGANGLE